MNKQRSIETTLTLIAINTVNASDANNTRLRELEATIRCGGNGSGGCSGFDDSKRLFRCPSYGAN